MRWAGLMLLIVPCTAFAQGAVDDRALRPPPLPPAPACELWEGTVSGNDPSVQVRARLCPQGDRVTGLLQWSSLQSGWNLREIEGTWAAGHTALTLRDVRVAESRPQPGWRFCTVDRYDLTAPRDGALTGTYDAAACNDHARVELHRTGESAAPPAPPTLPTASTPPPPPPPRARRFGCDLRVGPRAEASLAWLALALATRRRRTRAGHTAR